MGQFEIAVAIPTYKRKELLLRLIGSIPQEWSVFVSDNESSLVPLKGSLGPKVVVSHSPTLIPMFANWNRALSLVDEDATHVFIPSDDDLFLPVAREAVQLALQQYPESDIFIFGCDFFDEYDRCWKGYCPETLQAFASGDGFLKFWRGVDARMPGILFRKSFLNRIGAFDERFELTAADSDLIQRALLLGSSVFVPQVIGQYRIWSGSLTYARQATDLWMKEVTLWTDKIATLLASGHQPQTRNVNIDAYRDEIVAQNLLAGLHNLIAKGERKQALAFLERHRMPTRARLRTRLKLLRYRWNLRIASR